MFFESDQMDAAASEREMWLEKATAQINIAVQENPEYAKFYATKGRIYALQGLYDEAILLVKLAIEKEDSSRKDYADPHRQLSGRADEHPAAQTSSAAAPRAGRLS